MIYVKTFLDMKVQLELLHQNKILKNFYSFIKGRL
jgi:hypothetical protein